MADFVSRLIIDSKGYTKGLDDAKKAMHGFGAENKNFSKLAKEAGKSTENFTSMISKAGPLIGKFAAGLGVAMTAGEGFQKFLSSTQTLGDMAAANMQALQTSIDHFFYSMSYGGFDGFLRGLDDIISKSKDAYAAMDQLGNTQISYGVISAINKSQIADAQYVAKNKFAPTEARDAAFSQWRGALQNEMSAVGALRGELQNATVKTVQSRITADLQVNLQDIIKAFEVDLLDENVRAEEKARAGRGVNAFNAWESEHTDSIYDEERKALTEGYRQQFVTHALLEAYNDKELQGIADKITKYYNLNEALKSVAREYNETATEYNNSMKDIKGFTPVESLEGYTVYTEGTTAHKDFKPTQKTYAAGSIGSIDAQIKEASTLYAEVTSNAARVAALKTLNELKARKKELEFLSEHPNDPGFVKQERASFVSMAKMPDLNAPFEKTDGMDSWTDKMGDASLAVENMNGVLTAMQGITSSMGDNPLAGIFASMGNIMTVIPQLMALTTANAAVGASKLTFPASLIAIGTVFSTIAGLFASLNYADGGIVPGSNFHDGIRANVSSGEMFINQHDQSKLFKAIKTGNFGGNGGGVTRVSGEQLILAINNAGKRTGKGTLVFK